MKIHEYQAKKLFSDYGIPVERHILCNTPDEAVKAYNQLGNGKVAVKAQVLTGGRGRRAVSNLPAMPVKLSNMPKVF